jgi:hypothetical protein
VKISLMVSGFNGTLTRFARHRGQLTLDASNTAVQTASLFADRIALAAAFYPGRARCLEQTLTLYHLLRRRRIDARIRFGVQSHARGAHAWVEVGGHAINESRDFLAKLVILPELGA